MIVGGLLLVLVMVLNLVYGSYWIGDFGALVFGCFYGGFVLGYRWGSMIADESCGWKRL